MSFNSSSNQSSTNPSHHRTIVEPEIDVMSNSKDQSSINPPSNQPQLERSSDSHPGALSLDPSHYLPTTNSSSHIRRRDKILAACAGGLLTSLTMTPLDVVKTRLQTQGQPLSGGLALTVNQVKLGSPELFGCSSSLSHDSVLRTFCCRQAHRTHPGLNTAPSDRSLFSKIRSLTLNPSTSNPSPIPSTHLPYHGSSSICCELSHDHLHHLTQLKPSQLGVPSSSGILSTLIQIVNQEGVGSLWRGIGPTLLISIPSQAIYMLGYDALRSSLLEMLPPSGSESLGSNSLSFYRNTFVPLISGAVSRSFIAVLFSPLELLRTRLQSTPHINLPTVRTFDSNHLRANQSTAPLRIFKSILSSVKSSGPSTLYAGLPPTLWRDVPFSAIYWSSYEYTKKLITGGQGFGEIDQQSGVRQLATQSFIAGSLSGALAATLTNPFDVVKTRRQALVIHTEGLGSMRLIIQIGRQEGLRHGLMRGLCPRLAKIIPSCGITIASYEGLARVFATF